MRIPHILRQLFTLLASVALLPAQLTTQQREDDFRQIAAFYARNYAPANWKIQALNVNIFDLSKWLPRVRAAKSDKEYFQVAAEYIASFKDGHTGFQIPSFFSADSGLRVDIYDGKVLLESWNRTTYPPDQFDWKVGDELVQLDGRPVDEWLNEIVKVVGFGNDRAARRLAADRLVYRPQVVMPLAPDIPATSQAVFRDAEGNLKTYTLTWKKEGTPIENLSQVPSPFSTTQSSENGTPDYMNTLNRLQNWTWRQPGPARTFLDWTDQPTSWGDSQFVQGLSSPFPLFAPPPGFRQRLTPSPTTFFLTGTFEFEGKRFGLIKIPNFAPASPVNAIRQLETEIAFFKANTDGLVVDLMRNGGGGCVGLNYAKLLIPERFWFFGQQILAKQENLLMAELNLAQARAVRADQWVIDTYQFLVDELRKAMSSNRALTGPIPACADLYSGRINAPTFEYEPARSTAGDLLAYDKPVIFLVDDFSASFGDIFPAMMQDNNRGLIVGTRTAGLGGAVSGGLLGSYGESGASYTLSMVTRRQPIVTTDFPTAPYIENIGVRPDRELDYMTRENLLQRGAPFVRAFSHILLEEINKRQ